MTISGFTYVRNGFTFQYPFLQSIQSILPIVDELIVVVGDSTDGTREAIQNLGSEKIRIVDSVWDMSLREGGKIFAIQTNLGLLECKGDWLLHIQADEVYHESARQTLLKAIQEADKNPAIDGLLMPYYQFWGDYKHIRPSRKMHQFEIRAFKGGRNIFSYRDSQGFRKYSSWQACQNGEKGEKLKVLDSGMYVYHYPYCRNPRQMQVKKNFARRFWHKDNNPYSQGEAFDYNQVDYLAPFNGEHPQWMQEIIAQQDWEFVYDPSKSTLTFKDRCLLLLEKICRRPLFRYTNYILKGKVK